MLFHRSFADLLMGLPLAAWQHPSLLLPRIFP